MDKYNLIVIGGGFSGMASAISAARAGLRVLIIEKSNCFGGAATNSLVNPFMTNATVIEGKKQQLSEGIFAEFKRNMEFVGSAFDEEQLKLTANRMITQAGADILFRAVLIGADCSCGTINSVTVMTVGGQITLCADYFIDATGDAMLAYLCGCPFELGRSKDNLCQPMTLCFRIANIDTAAYRRDFAKTQEAYKKLKSEGMLRNVREDILWFDNCIDGVVHFNSTRVVKRDPTDPFELTKAELEAREQAWELLGFLKEHASGFEKAKIVSTAAEIGIRESRKIVGRYVLNADDLKSCRKFPDRIAAGNYDIDIHNPEGSGTSHYYFKPGEYYTIPYRSLLPQKVDNLLVAGRSISATHEAQASIRIMPICCCLGEAAGTAASFAAAGGTCFADIEATALQKKLTDNGAFIG